MPHASRTAVTEWQEADARAREAEVTLNAARYEFLNGGCEPPPELQAEARFLRKLADVKLKAAIASLSAANKR